MSDVFDGTVHTAYGQLYLLSDGVDFADPTEAFKGQQNGLCGTAIPGAAFLVTGTHTGFIPVRVRLLDAAPDALSWEEVVESSFSPTSSGAGLYGWADGASVRFDLPDAAYRLRWSCDAMDAGQAQDVATADRPAPDRYELAMWPAAAAPDVIVRRTSKTAAYWHDAGFPRE